ncbi:hypothetical protein ES332_A08G005100v1 [Gossypium tomentosum]|nr:hypothetical protein ES332_A08G005100v1 [Gossypium tomentosum]TYI12693.1 hypothetical protein ES332_A08G005100v1 [Gossypium tomentosum]
MIKKLEMEEEKVPELCVSLYKQYGTTMAGLKAIGYNFDYNEFHDFVHGRLPYELLKPDPFLKTLLHSLPIRKVIFTNADKNHADIVLRRLGLEDCFEGIICFETLNPTNEDDSSADDSNTEIFDYYTCITCPDSQLELPSPKVVCKPLEKAYEQVFEMANINPQKTLFFDDSIRNIRTGKSIGLHTVWVGTSQQTDSAGYALESIHNIRQALPELWEAADEKVDNILHSREVPVETTVIA